MRVSLDDIARALTPQSWDIIVDTLRKDKTHKEHGIKALRLASKSLRALVDGSVRSIHLVLRDTDKDLLDGGQLPPLKRWPRCTEFLITQDNTLGNGPLSGNILAVAFAGLDLEVRQRIFSVQLPLLPNLSGFTLSLASVLHGLPALQRVTLTGDLPTDRLEQRLLSYSLASLQGLRELQMPLSSMAYDIPTYAANLRTLVLQLSLTGDMMPDARVLSSIAGLKQLEHLGITDIHDPQLLQDLLQALPPTVQVLELSWCTALSGGGMCCEEAEVRFRNGMVSAFKANHVSYGPLAALICSRAPASSGTTGRQQQPQQLDTFRVDDLFMDGADAQMGREAVLLRTLLQHCPCVEVNTVSVSAAVPASWALSVVPLLGNFHELDLGVERPGGCGASISVWAAPDTRTRWSAAAAAASAGANQTGGFVPAPRSSLVMLALDGVVAVGAAAEVAQGKQQLQPSLAAAADGGGSGGLQRQFLLRGPLLADLVSDPAALKAFVRQLAEGPADQLLRHAVVSCVPLSLPPPYSEKEGAVLVACKTAADATALQAAAASAATLRSSFAKDMGPSPLAAVPLQARYQLLRLSGCWLCAVQKAAQDVWDGVGPSVAWSRAQRLRWLLEEWATVRAWPEEIRM